jgi:ketosteroid isomerase-like protein
VIGHYKARYTATGETLDAPFVHVWTVQDGEITSFQQYTDTVAHSAAMGG